MKKLLFLLLLGVTTTFGYYGYESCSTTYGYMAIDLGDGTCGCMSGFVMGTDFLGNKTCISGYTYCSDKFGYGATYDSLTSSCECSSGYVLAKDSYGDLQCIYGSTYCRDKIGYGSKYNSRSDSCECSSGYVLAKDSYGDLQCKTCFDLYGIHSSYDYLQESCSCNKGYTINKETGQCEEESVSAYFLLLEYDDNENKALVYSGYSKLTYLLDLRYASGAYKAEDFIGKNIVINMGTDSTVNRGDKFVLNNATKTTDIVLDIIAVEVVDDNYTLKSCEDIYGDNVTETYDNKCICNSGYEWNSSRDKCVFSTSQVNSTGSVKVYQNTVSTDDYYIYIGAAALLSQDNIIVPQIDPSNYNVSSLILRQELVGMTLSMKKIIPPKDYLCGKLFSDVLQNDWVCRAAELALQNNIVAKNKNFNPKANVTITEALAMIFNAYNVPYKGFTNTADVFYPGTQDWQKTILSYAKSRYWIESTYIDPNQYALRGEVFKFTVFAGNLAD